MRLTAVSLKVFGSLRDLQVPLRPGLNVVLGDNETGKSTLFAAIRHALLTSARLPPARLRRELGRYFPRPDGNELECEIVLEAGGEMRLVKRWGADPRAELTGADGARVTGADVDVRMEALLPVTPGTWSALFLTGQTELDATIERLRALEESRDEITAVLRRALDETGGVLVEAFERRLAARLREIFGRWDRDRDGPEGGRGIGRPWTRDVGELLRAWYALQTARGELEETARAEEELSEATAELEHSAGAFAATEQFLARHRTAYEAQQRAQAVATELAAQRRLLDDLRTANRRWPVVTAELLRVGEELEQARADVRSAEAGLARDGEERARAVRRTLYNRAAAARAEADAIARRLGGIPPVDDEAVIALREAERTRDDLRARLSAGTLRLRVASSQDVRLRLTGDDAEPVEREIGPDAPTVMDAHRLIRVETGAIVIEAESCDASSNESYEQQRQRLTTAEHEIAQRSEALGVSSAEEAVARRSERAFAERELSASEQRLVDLLDGVSYDELHREFARSGQEPASGPASAAGASDGTDWPRAVAKARQRLGAAQAGLAALQQEQKALLGRFESHEALEDLLVQARSRMDALEADLASAGAVPEGFSTAQEFLSRYREQEEELASVRERHHAARVAQAELLGRQPERTAEEVRADVETAERDYQRIRRRADAFARLEAAVRAVRSEDRDDPFEPLLSSVSRYLGVASEGAYTVLPSDDPFRPQRFIRAGGPELEYELLSQGTRDIAALALRLALAETALGGAEAPLLLDDPLVDMDPGRRVAAARAITEYAGERQLVLFTCHPDHAALFPGAHRVELPVPHANEGSSSASASR